MPVKGLYQQLYEWLEKRKRDRGKLRSVWAFFRGSGFDPPCLEVYQNANPE